MENLNNDLNQNKIFSITDNTNNYLNINMDNSLVEVRKAGSDHCWYEARLLDFDSLSTTDSFMLSVQIVSHQDSSDEKSKVQKFSCKDVRKHSPPNIAPVTPAENEIIEVLTQEGEDKLKLWKLAKVQKVKNNHAVVEYSDIINDSMNKLEKLDIIPLKDARSVNSSPTFTSQNHPLIRLIFQVPDYLLFKDDTWLADKSLHKDFIKSSNVANILFDAQTKQLICVGIAEDNTLFSKQKLIDRCNMMASWHFKALKEMYGFLRFQNVTKPQDSQVFLLPVLPKLIGLAIGHSGLNIKAARKIDGIKSLELDDKTSTFIITGSEESIVKAIELLNFKEEIIDIEGSFFEELLKNRNFIQEILNKSGLYQVDIGPQDSKPSMDETSQISTRKMHLIGTEAKIENFKILFNYQIAEYIEIASLKQKYQSLISKYLPRNSRTSASSHQTHRRSLRNFADAVKFGNSH